eukprot:4170923-Pleurochrysis_carterae.AAC.2
MRARSSRELTIRHLQGHEMFDVRWRPKLLSLTFPLTFLTSRVLSVRNRCSAERTLPLQLGVPSRAAQADLHRHHRQERRRAQCAHDRGRNLHASLLDGYFRLIWLRSDLCSCVSSAKVHANR